METRPRLSSIDALRGAVMVIMALDHTRDFIHNGAMSFSPEDLSRTTPLLFLTRWITHFCAPVFMFTAGVGAFLWWQRNRTKGQLSRFLWTRGLWLILLELSVMRLAYNFNLSMRFPILLLVLWALGGSMIALAALVYLPIRVLTILSVSVIALHNLLDGIQGTGVWNLIHQVGGFPLAGYVVVVGYPLIPWIAVMAAGFCFGVVMRQDAVERRRTILRLGAGLTLAFFVLRMINVYGDPTRWSHQASPIFTVMSFLNCRKYPPSLDFLLMTLGPALLVLVYLDQRPLKASNPLMILGRVPLFFFITHFFVIHLIAIGAAWLRYGQASYPILFQPFPSTGGPRELFPQDFGFDLWVVYAVWAVVVIGLYPLCTWFARVKAERAYWWLGYL